MAETNEEIMKRMSAARPTPTKSDTKSIAKVVNFNQDLLPDGVKEFAVDIAERMDNAPIIFSAITTMLVLSASIGRRVLVRPKLYDDWEEVPNLWGALIAPPSIKKTPIYSEAMKPLLRAEKEANEEYIGKMAQHVKEMKEYKSLDKDYSSGKIEIEPELPETPIRRRFVSQDATIEALAQIMIENPNGILMTVDELKGFFAKLNTKDGEKDRGFYLEAFVGKEGKSIDRVGRGSFYVPHVCASIFGTIQPDSILPLILGSKNGASGGDGLLQRFQLMAIVDKSDFKLVDRKPNKIARDEYHDVVKKIIDAEPKDFGAIYDEYNETYHYRFSVEANTVFNEWRVKNNKKQVAEQEHNPSLSSHFGKYEGLFASIALILFYTDRVRDIVSTSTIPIEYALKAKKWCELLEFEARKIYDIDKLNEIRRDSLDEKIILKVRELQMAGLLPISLGALSQKILGANAGKVKEALNGVAMIQGRKVIGFL